MPDITILIVEDDKTIQESLKATLHDLNYQVLAVADRGEGAIEFLSQLEPDIILMDISLPGELNGIKTTSIIQEKYDIPIIYLTAHDDDKTLKKAIDSGPYGYILKPFRESELKIAIELAHNKHLLEKRLRQSEARYRNLYETMNQGVVYQNRKGEIISANPAAERILGLTLSEMTGRTLFDPRWKSLKEDGTHLGGDDHPSMIALRSGKSIKNVILGIFNPKENKMHWITVDASPVYSQEEAEPIQVYTIFSDITEKKKQEEQLIIAKEKAEKSDRLKTEFLAQMSHEIRTPINNIITFISLLKEEFEDRLPSELRNSFKVLDSSSKRLIRTIELILNMSRIQTGNFDTKFEKLNLVDEIIEDALLEFYSPAKEKGLELKFEKKSSDNVITGDRYSLGQIFMNLIGNALKYTEKGFIKISVSQIENHLIVEIEDTGIGMKEEYLPFIFDPFSQEDGGYTRRFEGNGLGLALVKKYVDLNKAEITVKSKVNKGSTFTLKFKMN